MNTVGRNSLKFFGVVAALATGILYSAFTAHAQDDGHRGRGHDEEERTAPDGGGIGRELSIPVHLQDGQEFQISLKELLFYGEKLFSANWTIQEGAGRPLTKGTGNPLSDPTQPLV